MPQPVESKMVLSINPKPKASIPKISYHGIDLAKFIMAILVVTLHMNPFAKISASLDYMIAQGITRVAVPYFFVASSFLLFRKMSLDEINVQKVRKYIKHILRLYLVWSLIYLPIIIDERKGIHSLHELLQKGTEIVLSTIFIGSYWQLWFLLALLIAAIFITTLLFWKVKTRTIFIITGFGYLIAVIGTQDYMIFDHFFSERSPLWQFFHTWGMIFATPRNGICFASLFFFMGAYLATKHRNPSAFKVKAGMVFSLILLLMEVKGSLVFELTKVHYSHDCYFSLVPLTYFVFLYSKNLKLKDSPVWVYLRKQSMFIFYIHTFWIFVASFVVGWRPHAFIHLDPFRFYLVVLALSILSSHILIKLSPKEYFSYLKYLS